MTSWGRILGTDGRDGTLITMAKGNKILVTAGGRQDTGYWGKGRGTLVIWGRRIVQNTGGQGQNRALGTGEEFNVQYWGRGTKHWVLEGRRGLPCTGGGNLYSVPSEGESH